MPDTTSGFRAYNREAALQMNVVSKFTYTLETIIQAGKQTVAVDHVPIRTNDQTRESRLFPSMWSYVRRNTASIFRIYALYEPLRVFLAAAILTALAGAFLWIRFGVFVIQGETRRPRPVADPRLDALHRRGAVRRARRARATSSPGRACSSSASSSACGGSSCSSASSPRTTSRAPSETGQAATTGAQAGRATGKTEEREALKL